MKTLRQIAIQFFGRKQSEWPEYVIQEVRLEGEFLKAWDKLVAKLNKMDKQMKGYK
jgi:hypothetical protein